MVKQNNHIRLDDFNQYYKNQTKPRLDQNMDIEYMDKISSFISECSPDNALCQDLYINDIMDAPIIKDELEQVLRKAKIGKAGGADAIPLEFYKHSSEPVRKAILALFNYVFQSSEYPELWSNGIFN